MKQCPKCGRIANNGNLPNQKVHVQQKECGKCEEGAENREAIL